MMRWEQLFSRGWYAGRWDLDFGIKEGDRVLDIGGGNRPYPKATDIIDKDSPEVEIQRCSQKIVVEGRNLWDGYAEDQLPKIDNKYFDFMYSAHVLEHTDDLPFVLSEISRTCKRGFIILPHYYMDLWNSDVSSHHQWFFSFDHVRNVLKYRRRQPHEYIKELSVDTKPPILDWNNSIISGHFNNFNVRGLWEIRFYWEDSIDFEEDTQMYEESLYRREKFIYNRDATVEEVDVCNVCNKAENLPAAVDQGVELSVCRQCGVSFISRRKKGIVTSPVSEQEEDYSFLPELLQKHFSPGYIFLTVEGTTSSVPSIIRKQGHVSDVIDLHHIEKIDPIFLGRVDGLFLRKVLNRSHYPKDLLLQLLPLVSDRGFLLIETPSYTKEILLNRYYQEGDCFYNFTFTSLSYLLKEVGYEIVDYYQNLTDSLSSSILLIAKKAIV